MSTKLKRSELLFYVAYILWLVFAVMKLTYLKDLVPYKTINEFVENVVMVLLLLKLLDDDRHGLKGMVGIAIVGILYYVSIQAKAPGIMIPIYFIYSARNINYKDIFKVTMAIHLGVMAMSVVCSLNGIILNETWDEETRARYSLGYTFCTYGSHISFFLPAPAPASPAGPEAPRVPPVTPRAPGTPPPTASEPCRGKETCSPRGTPPRPAHLNWALHDGRGTTTRSGGKAEPHGERD